MSKTFDIKELVRVAVFDEKSGGELYKKMSEMARKGSVQDTFSGLVKQEKRHEERFQKMLDTLESSGEQTVGQYPDEYVDYLELLIAEGGSSEAHRTISENPTDFSLIELAMDFERDQLSLQRDMGTVLGERHRELIDEIIREEMGHLVTLSEMKKQLGP
jgi:rubrerythrin